MRSSGGKWRMLVATMNNCIVMCFHKNDIFFNGDPDSVYQSVSANDPSSSTYACHLNVFACSATVVIRDGRRGLSRV